MMGIKNSIPVRIDPEMNEILQEIRRKNDMSMRQASKELARSIKSQKIKGKKIVREIKF